ncbi:LOW QUALITY PROTEIN: uncharacterized protein LOC121934046 [Sceloporus undulatus]|uniref:LOW QUALITY PROTEIN: uncharacterized protein LOC121934046 n=1 Tax=Sceloporus undulatus TaxID=8520 RepID=UPI001C4ADC9C|nr:LOW QUALITY PROTEIN: uncharacterized protein LOC121934046 [Sceloporus undulatus]
MEGQMEKLLDLAPRDPTAAHCQGQPLTMSVRVAGGRAGATPALDGLRDNNVQWAASPCSISSDDLLSRVQKRVEQFLNEKKKQAPAESNVATCAVTLQASCWADSAAELKCAEAILDISKTILAPPVGSDSRSFTTDPAFYSHNTLASQHESDSSNVDSDDSIEKEIRAFLAVKAQTEHLITKSKVALHSVQIPPSSGQPAEQIQSLKIHPSPKPLKHSLSHKRKFKGGGVPTKYSSHSQFCGFCKPSTTRASWFWEKYNTEATKSGVDDKSSSLDSDEDLDTAVKELLRSKRKLKKKSKDRREVFEDLCRCTVVNSQENQGLVLSERPGLPLKRTAEERKVIFDGKLNQRNLPPEKDKARNLKVPNCLLPLSLFKHKNSYEFNISSNFRAGLKSTRNKKKPVLLGERQSTEVFLFKRQEGLSVPNFPGERHEMTEKRSPRFQE